MENIERVPVLRISKEEGSRRLEDPVAVEFLATIFLNDQELVTIVCSPNHLNYLAVGFLASQGLLQSKERINSIVIDDWRGTVRLEIEGETERNGGVFSKRLITSGCGGRANFYNIDDATIPKVESEMKISPEEIFNLANEFQHRSELYKMTHGVHSAALCDRNRLLVFDEDIGRHNAVDKIFGKCLIDDIPTQDRVLVTSGRVSSDILQKAAKMQVPIVISAAAPTDTGIRIADKLGIALVGSVRGKKMNIYSNDWRIVT